MNPDSRPTQKVLPATPPGHLPPRMRVLFIAGSRRNGRSLAEALAADRASEVVLDEAIGPSEAAARLRDQVFDAVLISHQPPDLDGLELLDAVRAGTSPGQPIVVLGEPDAHEMAAFCYEADADAYLCIRTATVRGLIWEVARAIERRKLIADNQRLKLADRQRLRREQSEAKNLLNQQQALLAEPQRCSESSECDTARTTDFRHEAVLSDELAATLVGHYRELLQAYVIMGSGHLAAEMQDFADRLSRAEVSARDALQIHLRVLDDMVQGLGNRSARHVMNRANLLILEMMMRLTDDYHQRAWQQNHPLFQQSLPGFETAMGRTI